VLFRSAPARGRRGADAGPVRVPGGARGFAQTPFAARERASGNRRGVSLALLLLLWALSTAAFAAPRIGVATMQPGEIFFERFGHNAIVVDDPAFAEPVSYNFGYFDLDEPGFTANFIRGEMYYMLVALPLSRDLEYYRQVGRGVSIQWLDLEPAQARRLAA